MKQQKKFSRPQYSVYGNIEGAPASRPDMSGRFCEIIFFCSNITQFMLNGTIYTAYKGDILTLLPSDKFTTNAADTDIFGIKIAVDLIIRLSTSYSDMTQLFTKMRKLENFDNSFTERAAAALRRMNDLRDFERFGDDILSMTELAKLLVDMVRARNKISGKKSAHTAKHTKDTVTSRSVMDYIDLNYSDPDLDLKKIATAMFFSASRLSHIFKAETGNSIYHYLTGKRLQCAHDMIARGCPVMEACTGSGFRSYCSFYRLYSKHFGISPASTRKTTSAEQNDDTSQ